MEFNGIAEGRKSNLMFTDILLSSSGEFDEETSFTAAGWNVEANAALMTCDGLLPSPFFGATTHVNAIATATSPDSSMNFASSFSSMSSSSCSSDEDLDGAKRKANEEDQGGQIPPKRKHQQEEDDAGDENRRKRKGSATDPQSVYARKRRERINERLKILQNLVPNGTKVDISTMLEQAIQYVKFMQLQIKLLSSDEHWMYTPIAFNGCLPYMDTLQ